MAPRLDNQDGCRPHGFDVGLRRPPEGIARRAGLNTPSSPQASSIRAEVAGQRVSSSDGVVQRRQDALERPRAARSCRHQMAVRTHGMVERGLTLQRVPAVLEPDKDGCRPGPSPTRRALPVSSIRAEVAGQRVSSSMASRGRARTRAARSCHVRATSQSSALRFKRRGPSRLARATRPATRRTGRVSRV